MPRVDRRVALLALAAGLLVLATVLALRGGGADQVTAEPLVPPPEPPLVVHVAGAVRAPGLYRLPRGSRVADAVEAAGGARRRAAVDAINLAAPLADGQRIAVPVIAAVPTQEAGAGTGETTGPLSLSSASAEALDALPGIGPATAAEIIAWRDANGGFASVEDLERVPGIGPAKLEALRPHVVP